MNIIFGEMKTLRNLKEKSLQMHISPPFHVLEAGMIREDTTIQPKEATTEDLLVVHPRSYIDSLKVSNVNEYRVIPIKIEFAIDY